MSHSNGLISDDVVSSGELRAPFPWFGGKSRAAKLVWPRFGDVHNYVEPFAGSLATLLKRPHAPRVETVNDLDCYLANFWRALQSDPEAVAYWADSPINEADLHARHRWLVEQARERVKRTMREPEFFDAQIAGWWVWGQCLWIGSGWCQSPGEPTGRAGRAVEQRRRPTLTNENGHGVHTYGADEARSGERPHEQRKRPAASGNGESVGIHQPSLHRRWQGGGERGGGSGVHAVGLTRQMPRIAAEGGSVSGVTASTLAQKKPRLGGSSNGANNNSTSVGVVAEGTRTEGLCAYLAELASRLRRVRVCCGDWSRVLTPSVTTYIGETAVFLDPPYKHELRERCYSEDHDISADVRAWAIAHGDDPKFRIALCGYDCEHEMPDSWDCVRWKAHGGYSRTERGVANRDRERIWFSPFCLRPELPLWEASR